MNKTTQKQKNSAVVGKQRSFAEVTTWLDQHWASDKTKARFERMQQLDKALGNPSKATPLIAIGGTNGKSLTIHFAARLLKEEGVKVGAFTAPHTLTYNERFSIDNEIIAQKDFTDFANEVINATETAGIEANSLEILTMMTYVIFKKYKVEAGIVEVTESGTWDPTTYTPAKVVAITRITEDEKADNHASFEATIKDVAGMIAKDAWVVSADQNKNNLQTMQDMTEERKAHWAMPIRKLAQLAYPFEQLHGRCAALAERACQLFMESITSDAEIVKDSLLIKQKGQRGRPTLEAKRHLELNPKRTIEQYWKEVATQLSGRFELLEKETPAILLDNASNLDAFQNLLLGVRLMHYQKPIKGLSLIVGVTGTELENIEFVKLLRYFFRKTSGQVFFCPVEQTIAGHSKAHNWDIEKITNEVKNVKIKAKACKNFKEALDAAKKSVDERNGLVVISGSHDIIAEYWLSKGINKF